MVVPLFRLDVDSPKEGTVRLSVNARAARRSVLHTLGLLPCPSFTLPGTPAPLISVCVFVLSAPPRRVSTGPVVVRLAERANERERERETSKFGNRRRCFS